MSPDSDAKAGAVLGLFPLDPDRNGRYDAGSSAEPALAAERNGGAPCPSVKGLRRDSQIRQSLEEVIEESERETQQLSSQERLMLGNLLKFGELLVADVMVPRADIVAVEEQMPLASLVALFRDAQHSRLPIYRETLDDPLGMVHIKDVLALVETGADGQLRWPETRLPRSRDLCSYQRDVRPRSREMRATHQHGARRDGLWRHRWPRTIEDLVEEIVSDIDDEHDMRNPRNRRARHGGGCARRPRGLQGAHRHRSRPCAGGRRRSGYAGGVVFERWAACRCAARSSPKAAPGSKS